LGAVALLCIGALAGCDALYPFKPSKQLDGGSSVVDARTVDGQVTPGEAGSTGTIAIYLAGDLKPKTFLDTYAGQTPDRYQIALSKYQLLTSANDTQPVLCFDHGAKPVVADLSKDTLMGECQTATIPTATYTHGRVKLDWLSYRVGVTVHLVIPNPGTLTIFSAYSNTTYQGKAYKAKSGSVAFSGIVGITLPATFETPRLPGFRAETTNGETWITFPFSRPLLVDQKNTQRHWARFYWEIYKSFRWQDLTATNHKTNVWDIYVTNHPSYEAVKYAGVTGYHITTSMD